MWFSLGPSHSATEKLPSWPQGTGAGVLEAEAHLEQHDQNGKKIDLMETCMVRSTEANEGAEIRGAANQGHAPGALLPVRGPRIPKVPRTFRGPQGQNTLMIPSSPRRDTPKEAGHLRLHDWQAAATAPHVCITRCLEI